jgi:hypothetical protein
MKTDVTKATAEEAEGTLFLGDDWFDPLEAGVRTAFAASSRSSWNRNSTLRWGETGMNGLGLREGRRRATGCRSRPPARPCERGLMGTFGGVTVRVPRGRLETPDDKTAEWKNATIPAHRRRTKRRLNTMIFSKAAPFHIVEI